MSFSFRPSNKNNNNNNNNNSNSNSDSTNNTIDNINLPQHRKDTSKLLSSHSESSERTSNKNTITRKMSHTENMMMNSAAPQNNNNIVNNTDTVEKEQDKDQINRDSILALEALLDIRKSPSITSKNIATSILNSVPDIHHALSSSVLNENYASYNNENSNGGKKRPISEVSSSTTTTLLSMRKPAAAMTTTTMNPSQNYGEATALVPPTWGIGTARKSSAVSTNGNNGGGSSGVTKLTGLVPNPLLHSEAIASSTSTASSDNAHHNIINGTVSSPFPDFAVSSTSVATNRNSTDGQPQRVSTLTARLLANATAPNSTGRGRSNSVPVHRTTSMDKKNNGLIRTSEVEAALRSKPQRGRKRENLSVLERIELTRTRNREHAKSTRIRKKLRYEELLQHEQKYLELLSKEKLSVQRSNNIHFLMKLRTLLLSNNTWPNDFSFFFNGSCTVKVEDDGGKRNDHHYQAQAQAHQQRQIQSQGPKQQSRSLQKKNQPQQAQEEQEELIENYEHLRSLSLNRAFSLIFHDEVNFEFKIPEDTQQNLQEKSEAKEVHQYGLEKLRDHDQSLLTKFNQQFQNSVVRESIEFTVDCETSCSTTSSTTNDNVMLSLPLIPMNSSTADFCLFMYNIKPTGGTSQPQSTLFVSNGMTKVRFAPNSAKIQSMEILPIHHELLGSSTNRQRLPLSSSAHREGDEEKKEQIDMNTDVMISFPSVVSLETSHPVLVMNLNKTTNNKNSSSHDANNSPDNAVVVQSSSSSSSKSGRSASESSSSTSSAAATTPRT